MATAKWAIEHANKVADFLEGVGVEEIPKNIREMLAHEVDDEIQGYCDNCEEKGKCDNCERPSGPLEI